jgi:hypothetical protein
MHINSTSVTMREISMNSTIILADQDRIDQLSEFAADFFDKIFNIDFNSAIITDESEIIDFAMAAIPENCNTDNLSLADVYGIADDLVISKIDEIYGIQLKNTRILVIDVLGAIESDSKMKVN